MSGIFSCFTRQSPVDTLQAFQNAVERAGKDNRVSSSNLNDLLKAVKNSPQQLTLNQYRKIQENVESLDLLLKKQHSNLHQKKDTKITEALTQASHKLNPDAKTSRASEAREGYRAAINDALETIKKNIPKMQGRVGNANAEISSTIARLPTTESQKKAMELVSSKHYSAFGKDTAVTHRLFPSRREEVERRNGYRPQDIQHPHKSTWMSLESQCQKLATAEATLSKATSYLNHPDNFTFNKPDSTGRLELTSHQLALLKFV